MPTSTAILKLTSFQSLHLVHLRVCRGSGLWQDNSYDLLSAEQQERQRKSRETRLKLARLPHHKRLEEFDFTFQPSIDKRQIEELGTLAFVARNENVIFLGPPGVGKTHLSVGLALRALDAGMVVYYTTLSCLTANLKKTQTQGHLERRWRIYLRPALLVIDEVGYMQLNCQEAELLFQPISNMAS